MCVSCHTHICKCYSDWTVMPLLKLQTWQAVRRNLWNMFLTSHVFTHTLQNQPNSKLLETGANNNPPLAVWNTVTVHTHARVRAHKPTQSYTTKVFVHVLMSPRCRTPNAPQWAPVPLKPHFSDIQSSHYSTWMKY